MTVELSIVFHNTSISFLTDGRKFGPINHGPTSPETLLEVNFILFVKFTLRHFRLLEPKECLYLSGCCQNLQNIYGPWSWGTSFHCCCFMQSRLRTKPTTYIFNSFQFCDIMICSLDAIHISLWLFETECFCFLISSHLEDVHSSFKYCFSPCYHINVHLLLSSLFQIY